MQTLKAICTAAILALALTVPVYAGDVDTPGYKATNSGEIQSPAVTSGIASTIPTATDILVSLLRLL